MKHLPEILILMVFGGVALVYLYLYPEAAGPDPVDVQATSKGDLVQLVDGRLEKADVTRLKDAEYIGIYFGADWCGPCRKFVPKLRAFYNRYHKEYDNFEIVYYSKDRSNSQMLRYMKSSHMPWPAVPPGKGEMQSKLGVYDQRGVPNLVLIDAKGRRLMSSYRNGRYVGPYVVLKEMEKRIRESAR